MNRWLAGLSALALVAVAPMAAAQACTIMARLSPERVAATPVVVRGEITAVEFHDNLDVTLTVSVEATLQGTRAESWRVTWSAFSVVVPPHSLPEFAERYGLNVVIGFAPNGPGFQSETPPEHIDTGTGAMPGVACGEPFVGAYADLAPLLREAGLVE